MTNSNGYRSPRKRSRLLTVIIVAALNLTIVANAFAAELVNGEFETNMWWGSFCSTSGWQISGNVGANTENNYGLNPGSSECVARVHASSDGAPSASTLSQTVTVSNHNLVMLLDTQSYMGGTQTVTVYDASGAVIYTKSNSTDGRSYYFCQGFSAYVGQTVTIELKASVAKSLYAYRSATLFADKVHFASGCFWPSSASGW